MISKNDCLLLLADLHEKGINTSASVDTLMRGSNIPLSVLKQINDNRQLDLSVFYNQIRVNYNKKKSSLYINIVKDITEPKDVLTTLSALSTQILLFGNKLENRQMFIKHSRLNEITKVLNIYANTYDLTNCIKLLRVIKADLKALESIKEKEIA